MKVLRDKLINKILLVYAQYFAPAFKGRTHPFTTLEGRFSLLFAQSLYYGKLSFCAKIQPFPPCGKIRTANFRGYARKNAVLLRFIFTI